MKFCFFGYISCAIKGETVGGGELQVYLLAKSLALQGHEVVIIDPYAGENLSTPEGIQLITVPHWFNGLKGIRMLTYRFPALWKLFVDQQADVYYVRMRSYLHLIPYYAAKKVGGKFIQAIASDIDILSFKKKFKYEYKSGSTLFKFFTREIPNDISFNFLLKKSDFITLQHLGQKFDSKSPKGKQVLFSNIFDNTNLPAINKIRGNYFIYAGSLTMLKGADNLLRLIKIIDKSISIMIVGIPQCEQTKNIFEEIKKYQNVIIKGRLTQKETIQLISNAKALINTSYYEGFPNIFLEAWATGVPVISLTVNPGHVISEYKLGICCDGNLNRMKQCMELDETAQIDSEELKLYVDKYHDFKTAGERFINTLNADS